MIGIIVISLVVILEATIHWYVIEKRNEDPKKNRLLMFYRTGLYLILSIILTGAVYSWSEILPLVFWLAVILGTRYALFDYALNLMRGKPIYHLGNITLDDRIESKIDGKLLLFIKSTIYLAVAVASIVMF